METKMRVDGRARQNKQCYSVSREQDRSECDLAPTIFLSLGIFIIICYCHQ